MLIRNKNYTLLNIAGLSIGIAVGLVIFMIILFETGYDGFHKNKDRIYRVLTVYSNPVNGPAIGSGIPAPLPSALHNDFPTLKVADISAYGSIPVSALATNGQIAKSVRTDLFFTEPSFFEIFDFQWAAGDAKASLDDPNAAEQGTGSGSTTTTTQPSSAYILQASSYWVLISIIGFSVYFM